MRVVNAHEMKRIEDEAEKLGINPARLMENAGRAIAKSILSAFPSTAKKPIVFLIGKGNNGGDGLIAAGELAKAGHNTVALLFGQRSEADMALNKAQSNNVNIIKSPEVQQVRETCEGSVLVVDAVLGTGAKHPLNPKIGELLAAAKGCAPVWACDLPSGVDPNNGTVHDLELPADKTLMLGCYKLAGVLNAGRTGFGEMEVLDIGIPSEALKQIPVVSELIDHNFARQYLPKRKDDFHKGHSGSALIVAGSKMYPGAAIMAARAAVKSGVGLVHLLMPQSIYDVCAGSIPEAVMHPAPEDENGVLCKDALGAVTTIAQKVDWVLVGPGLGRSTSVITLISELLTHFKQDKNLIFDADALFALSQLNDWHVGVKSDLILTPHPKEMATLLNISVAEVQLNRYQTALNSAAKFGSTMILKGAATIISNRLGRSYISPWANSAMAKGGSGDVLAGLLVGLASQMPGQADEAAALAVFLHGLAAKIAADKFSKFAATPTDIINQFGSAFLELQ